MSVIKFLVLVMNLAFMSTIIYFLLPLKWSYSADRPSIVGFIAMICTIVIDMLMILVAAY